MAASLSEAFLVQRRVIGALVLRDMRTRFGRTFFGYLIIVGWPLTHLLGIMGVYLLSRRVAPIGASVPIFLATGVLPYILCLYPARMTMMCLVQNQPLMQFPIVKATDVILARSILEILTACWVTAIFAAALFIFGVDITPIHYQDAIQAILATIYFGFAVGFFSAVVYRMVRAYMVILIGLMIGMYVTAGVFFIPTNLPEELQNYLWYNPLLHCVEWLRSAYFEGYGYGMLNREYLLSVSTMFLVMGLLLERAARGRLLHG